jgi:hypothetical protein
LRAVVCFRVDDFDNVERARRCKLFLKKDKESL